MHIFKKYLLVSLVALFAFVGVSTPQKASAQFSDCSVYFCKDMKYSWTKKNDVYRLQVYLANNGFFGPQAIGQPVASGRYWTNTVRAVWWFKNKYYLEKY